MPALKLWVDVAGTYVLNSTFDDSHACNRLLTVKYQNYHGMFFTLCSLEAIYFHFEDKKNYQKSTHHILV